MPSTPWKYEENTFLSTTDGNVSLMGELLRDHYPKLVLAAISTPVLEPARDATALLLGDWNTAENALHNAEALLPAATGALDDKRASMTRKPDFETNSPIETWDSTIRSQVAFGGSIYMTLLPHGRETLTAGSHGERIEALESFVSRLQAQTTKPVLVTLASTVNIFYNAVKDLRDTQTNRENALRAARDHMETLRKAVAWQMFTTVGTAMSAWNTAELTFRIGALWDLSLIRETAPLVPEAPVLPVWDMPAHSLTVPALPLRATRLEAWRLGPGGAPELLAVGERDATVVVIPADITWDPGDHYQLWVRGRNSAGSGPESQRIDWNAP